MPVPKHELLAADVEMFLREHCGIALLPWQRQWLERLFQTPGKE